MISNSKREYFEIYMKEALVEAKKAYEQGEVPVGVIAVINDKIVARAHNLVEENKDPTDHAELIIIKDLVRKMESKKLTEVNLYVTLEPCIMCAEAIKKVQLGALIFGAYDDKLGAVGSRYDLIRDPNHKTDMMVLGGILSDECSAILKDFFSNKR